MALINHAKKEITAKLVYYGAGLCGKTTNLQWIHDHVDFKGKGKLLSLATEADRTLFFDFLPVELAPIRGMRTRVQIYTVPGQVFYDFTRKMVLRDADGVVFVADSQARMLEANVQSLENLRLNLIANDLDPGLPMVLQYNKRDLATALPVAVLNAKLNPRGLPYHEAVAVKGVGVPETLKTAVTVLFKALSEFYGTESRAAGPPPLPARPTAPTAARAPAGAPPQAPVAPAPGPRPVVAMPEPARAAAAGPARAAAAGPARAAASAEPKPPGVSLRPDEWMYLPAGKAHGPLPVDDLVDLLLTSLPEDTMVWGPQSSRWTPASSVSDIAEYIPPPLPRAAAVREEDFPDFNTVPRMLRTALIADGDGSFRQLLALPLAAQGFKIYEARDGAEAWKLATEQRPWVMLADLGMPEVDGFEFCRRVRANHLLSHTPLVFISDSDRYKDRYRAMQLGADDFLSKHTPIRELLIRIQLLLTRYSDLQAAAGTQAGAEGGPGSGALEGQIEVFGAPGVLQICNQGRLTGIFTARAQDEARPGEKVAVFGFRDGEIVTATVQDLAGPAAVYAFLAWTRGQFKFVPGDPGAGVPLAHSVEHLLLEGCRRIDESRTGGPHAGG
jgi:mutual gliding-motility protein MglA